MCDVQRLIYRLNKIVLPKKLQKKIIKIAHEMGHFGKSKTKNMFQAKYWFPAMNSMIYESIEQCYECQVVTKQHTEEPIKPSIIPSRPWEEICVDFGGPYPDGHYNLVAVDKRTRYPEVEIVNSTSFQPTQAKLKQMFGHHCTPDCVYSDNGPPFNSHEFAKFAEQEGFAYHRVTLEHPRANGEAETFMQLLNKTEQIAHMQGKTKLGKQMAVQDMLNAYRDTPHPAIGVTPYEAMLNRPIRTKLNHEEPGVTDQNEKDQLIDQHDKQYKDNMRSQRRNSKEHNFKVGDIVLVKQRKRNKWSAAFEPAFYSVIKIQGLAIFIRRNRDGRELCRDASHLKMANQLALSASPALHQEQDEEMNDCRTTGTEDTDTSNGEEGKAARQNPNAAPKEQQQIIITPQLSSRPRRERQQLARLTDYVLK